jgi:uncharacterized caspase-like protein
MTEPGVNASRTRIARFVALLALLACALTTWSVGAQPQEKRVALVIGNASYKFSPLKNPVNDAQAMAGALKDLGFDVTLLQDAKFGEMIDAMGRFVRAGKTADVRLFYYAGHGMQVKGRNYLVPVDAQLTSEDEVGSATADITEFLTQLGVNRKGLNIVILDACRNNPFAGSNVLGPDGRVVRFRGAAAPGLAEVAAPVGTLIAYATSPGQVAMDGGNLHNSLYTRYLLENIMVPSLPIEWVFKRVRIEVQRDTQNLQTPWENSSLTGDFCFREMPGKGCAVAETQRIGPIQTTPR